MIPLVIHGVLLYSFSFIIAHKNSQVDFSVCVKVFRPLLTMKLSGKTFIFSLALNIEFLNINIWSCWLLH